MGIFVLFQVQNILELLDISNIQDTQAEKLSGGQKRKLSIGIAMLGNPQVKQQARLCNTGNIQVQHT